MNLKVHKSDDWIVNKDNVVYEHNGALFSHEEEWN